MFTCRVCRFDVTLDDTIVRSLEKGTCICLSCYLNEVQPEHQMPKSLRKQIEIIALQAA